MVTLDCASIQKAIKNSVEDCDLPRLITTLSLRLSYATQLLEKGVDLREIQSIMEREVVRKQPSITLISPM